VNRAGAAAAGCVLFALPFLQSGLGESHWHGAGPHLDHAPRHGGSLLMVGDFHVEVVEGAKRIELYVSDAERRPLEASSVEATYDGRREGEVRWDSYRLVAPRPPGYSVADYRIRLGSGTSFSFRWRGGSRRS